MTKERPKHLEINVDTGEQTLIDLTDEEIAQMEAIKATWEAEQIRLTAEAEALAALKASAKAKLVAGQPLTAEEADTLVV